MQRIEVGVENDHIQRITTARPLIAIAELIWNAYDADASIVRVKLQKGTLTNLGAIRVIDNGTGIPFDQATEFFRKLGGSWKKYANKTIGGRIVHGERGQGRFKAFALGQNVSWTSDHDGRRFTISGSKGDLKNFTISDPVSSHEKGCIVLITDIVKDFKIWASDGFADRVRDVFALQLFHNANFQIIYDDVELDARESISSVTPVPINVLYEGQSYSAELEIVE